MTTKVSRWALALACCLSLAIATVATAEPAPEAKTPTNGGAHVSAAKVFRSSTLSGMEVKNTQGDSIGKIEELVIDIASGKVSYAALSVGGLLGVGDKLFAVPFDQFTLKHDEKNIYFVLDVSKEKLAAAPGFNKDKWPNVADANWMQEINRYYQQERRQAETPVTPPRR